MYISATKSYLISEANTVVNHAPTARNLLLQLLLTFTTTIITITTTITTIKNTTP